MNNIGLHVIGGFNPWGLVGPRDVKPYVVKLVNCSQEYKVQVRQAVGPECLIIVRWVEEVQPLSSPRDNALDWYGKHWYQISRMADPNTAFEGYNEIGDDNAVAYNQFEVERLDIMHSGGFRSIVGNFSVGCPDIPDGAENTMNIPMWNQIYKPMLNAMRPGDFLGLHEYWPPFNTWYLGRWRLVPILKDVPIIITECGREAGGWKQSASSEDAYIYEIRQYSKLLGNKLGCVFTGGMDPKWKDYNVNEIWHRITSLYKKEENVVPEVWTLPQLQELATNIAASAGISVAIFMNIINVESRWNPSAINPVSKCTGLAQLNPRFFSGNLLDPRINLTLAAGELVRLLKYYKDWTKTIVAYNWGQGNLDKCIKKYGITWLEHIPKETQKHVRQSLFGEAIT